MTIEFRDGDMRRIVEVEHDGAEVLVFDTVEEDDVPGARSLAAYPPEMALRLAEQIAEHALAVMAMRAPMPPLLRLIERRAA
jgi:hypothetical protein